MAMFLMILTLLPKIIEAIRSIEAFLPISGIGKEKLGLITGIALDVGGEAAQMIPTIERVVSRLVSFANAFGIFKKTLPPPPSPLPPAPPTV